LHAIIRHALFRDAFYPYPKHARYANRKSGKAGSISRWCVVSPLER
jgi:hypothetical protein